jgi:putative ABC transport system permease protein
MNLLKIAWRNLWRNKRRTAITAASILFAVFFAILMRSIELGSYRHMIKSAIESYAGFLQVQHPDYQDDPSLENTINLTAMPCIYRRAD